MLTPFQAILFGALQGITELFPISSLGHSVILPRVVGWHIAQKDPFFLTFLVATHTATAFVLFLFFWKDWRRIIAGLLRSLKEREIKTTDHDAKLAWLLVVGTVPAGVLGLLFEEPLQALFASPRLVAFVLILNGLLLLAAEQIRKKNIAVKQTEEKSNERISALTWFGAVKVGLMQCLALIPGFSRTGSTITGSLLVGLSHEDAARYAFLLATPIIGAASLLKLPELASSSEIAALGPTMVGAVAAGVTAYISVRFLTRYFETEKLTPFAVYCIAIGGFVSFLFLFR